MISKKGSEVAKVRKLEHSEDTNCGRYQARSNHGGTAEDEVLDQERSNLVLDLACHLMKPHLHAWRWSHTYSTTLLTLTLMWG